jgi:hypothetical protein
MPNQPKSPIIAGRVSAELKAWVEHHAKDTGRTMTDVLTEALDRYRKRATGSQKRRVATSVATETIKAPPEIKGRPGQTVRSRRDSNPQPSDP